MKVIAFNGSARKDGNTSIMVNTVLNVLQNEGIETEHISLAGRQISGCIACYRCFREPGRCHQKDDGFINEAIQKISQSQGVILGSPVYFADVTANMKALMERTGMVARAAGDMFRRKVGAAVVAVRRGGAVHTFDSLNHYFLIAQMIVVGSIYWNLGRGLEPGDVNKDEEGLRTMRILGENMAWVIKKLYE
ncbi:flavodoxin family protein [Thermogutta sp.]|uniref:flavodoxin family protein n=1 Tax=Thermogutta sp. TaxID=1962930 RepID=UPI003C7BB2AD